MAKSAVGLQNSVVPDFQPQADQGIQLGPVTGTTDGTAAVTGGRTYRFFPLTGHIRLGFSEVYTAGTVNGTAQIAVVKEAPFDLTIPADKSILHYGSDNANDEACAAPYNE